MKTVVLLGAGHAHLEILKDLASAETSQNRYVLISPHETTAYSGLLPRTISGDIRPDQIMIPAARYARNKGVHFIQAQATQIDLQGHLVIMKNQPPVHFHILSINIGGEPMPIETDCPARTVYLKPMPNFLEKWREILQTLDTKRSLTLAVIGGGAAAIEIASALQTRVSRNPGAQAKIHLITQGNRLGEQYTPPISQALEKSLRQRGIEIHLRQTIHRIGDRHLALDEATTLDFDYVFVATPTVPARLSFSQGGVVTDIQQPEVSDRLELAPDIFAAGDFTRVKGFPALTKSGVIAVHQGRHLAQAIRRRLQGQDHRPFAPPKNQLNILTTSDHSAVAIWSRFHWSGSVSWYLKKWIDDRYMKSFD